MNLLSGSAVGKDKKTPAYIKSAAVLITLIASVYVLHALQETLVPLLFAVLVSILLFPVCSRLERWKFPRILAILLSILLFTIVIAALIYLVTIQVGNFADELPLITDKAEALLEKLTAMGERYLNVSRSEQVSRAKGYLLTALSDSRTLLLNTLVATTGTLTTAALVPLYVFFFLLYRDFFRRFVHKALHKVSRNKVNTVLDRIYEVIQSYLAGLLLVIGIVGVLNTIGLLILGIDYAVFFGFLAAFLILIPYVGILIGSLFPALMSIITEDSAWYAVGVIGVMAFVQFLEGNFITPNIVGSKVSINPLAAIVMLLLGGQLWGLPGLVLALPLTAILKVILDANRSTEPFGFLLGEPGKEVQEEKAIEISQDIRERKRRPGNPERRRSTTASVGKEIRVTEPGNESFPPRQAKTTDEVVDPTDEKQEVRKRRRPSRRRKKPASSQDGDTSRNSGDQDS